ncbi:MAG: serine hydrolase domain-containing protein [Bacteroidales bacterium]
MKVYFILFSILFLFGCKKLELTKEFDVIVDKEFISNPRNTEFSTYLKDYFLSTQTPGSILLIAENDSLWIGSIGFSNIEKQKLMTYKTQFRIGSITKVFISVLILKLIEENKLSFENKISDFLPYLKNKIPDVDKITIRQLLSHTSGIIDPPNQSIKYQSAIVNNPNKFSELSQSELLQKYVYDEKLIFEPAKGYSYSNAGYWILGLIIETIEKKTVYQVLNEKILIPYGLKNTYLEKKENNNVAFGYTKISNSKIKDVTIWDIAEGDGKTAGGIISSAYDLYLFYKNLFSFNIISENLVKEMKQIQYSECNSPDCEYGLGLELWRLNNYIAYGHNGSLIGIETNALYIKEKNTIIVIYKNLGGGSNKSFIDEILK